jgi:hypothetical protein
VAVTLMAAYQRASAPICSSVSGLAITAITSCRRVPAR